MIFALPVENTAFVIHQNVKNGRLKKVQINNHLWVICDLNAKA